MESWRWKEKGEKADPHKATCYKNCERLKDWAESFSLGVDTMPVEG